MDLDTETLSSLLIAIITAWYYFRRRKNHGEVESHARGYAAPLPGLLPRITQLLEDLEEE